MGRSTFKLNLKQLGVTRPQMMRGEIPVLNSVIDDGEVLEAVILGYHDTGYALMAATNMRMLFIDKLIIGSKCDNIAYSTITDVSTNFKPLSNEIQIYTRARNFHFKLVKRKQLLKFASCVERHMMAISNIVTQQQTLANGLYDQTGWQNT